MINETIFENNLLPIFKLNGSVGIEKPKGNEDGVSTAPPYFTKPITVAKDGYPELHQLFLLY